MIKFLTQELKCHSSLSNGISNFYTPKISAVEVLYKNFPSKIEELVKILAMFAIMTNHGPSKKDPLDKDNKLLKTLISGYDSDFDFQFEDPQEIGIVEEKLALADDADYEKESKGKEKERGNKKKIMFTD